MRAKLTLVERARQFAGTQLALSDHGSYHSYADLGRDYVVWNVFAAPELSLTPLSACYPFIGCVDYRGFFSEARARLHAATLQARGYDTFVGGVAAYSTLGWLNDPVLNTVLRRDDVHLVDIIFHELAHQRLYIVDDTTFNESFAMAVARAGVTRWLADDAPALARYRAGLAREADFIALLRDFTQRLTRAYAARSTTQTSAPPSARCMPNCWIAIDFCQSSNGAAMTATTPGWTPSSTMPSLPHWPPITTKSRISSRCLRAADRTSRASMPWCEALGQLTSTQRRHALPARDSAAAGAAPGAECAALLR